MIEIEKEDKKENLTTLWLASNLPHEELQKILKGKGKGSDGSEPTIQEVNDDWKRLASFMSGKT